jgi:predicted RNase H-like nuclease (RuvC/YqgF family)
MQPVDVGHASRATLPRQQSNLDQTAEQGREGERARADALRDRLETLQAQVAQLEAEGAASDVQAAKLTSQLRQARAEVQEALQAADAQRQAEAERRGGGRWAPLRRAWRDE